MFNLSKKCSSEDFPCIGDDILVIKQETQNLGNVLQHFIENDISLLYVEYKNH
jgi:hypothetical protein